MLYAIYREKVTEETIDDNIYSIASTERSGYADKGHFKYLIYGVL